MLTCHDPSQLVVVLIHTDFSSLGRPSDFALALDAGAAGWAFDFAVALDAGAAGWAFDFALALDAGAAGWSSICASALEAPADGLADVFDLALALAFAAPFAAGSWPSMASPSCPAPAKLAKLACSLLPAAGSANRKLSPKRVSAP